VYFNFTGPVHLTIGFRLKRPLVVLVKVIGKLRLSSGARNAGVPIDITTGSAMVIHFSAEAQLFSFEATAISLTFPEKAGIGTLNLMTPLEGTFFTPLHQERGACWEFLNGFILLAIAMSPPEEEKSGANSG